MAWVWAAGRGCEVVRVGARPLALRCVLNKRVPRINAAAFACAAPQGFRPGLRTNAPIRGLKTRRRQAPAASQNTVLIMDKS